MGFLVYGQFEFFFSFVVYGSVCFLGKFVSVRIFNGRKFFNHDLRPMYIATIIGVELKLFSCTLCIFTHRDRPRLLFSENHVVVHIWYMMHNLFYSLAKGQEIIIILYISFAKHTYQKKKKFHM